MEIGRRHAENRCNRLKVGPGGKRAHVAGRSRDDRDRLRASQATLGTVFQGDLENMAAGTETRIGHGLGESSHLGHGAACSRIPKADRVVVGSGNHHLAVVAEMRCVY